MHVACNAVGGPDNCEFVAEGDSYEELAEALEDHAYDEHPELAEEMEEMTADEVDEWFEMMMSQVEE